MCNLFMCLCKAYLYYIHFFAFAHRQCLESVAVCVAVCYNACCSMLHLNMYIYQCVVIWCCVLQCVMQSVVMCCSVLQYTVVMCCIGWLRLAASLK